MCILTWEVSEKNEYLLMDIVYYKICILLKYSTMHSAMGESKVARSRKRFKGRIMISK